MPSKGIIIIIIKIIIIIQFMFLCINIFWVFLRAHFKLCLTALAKKSLSRAHNIFMAANINSIVLIIIIIIIIIIIQFMFLCINITWAFLRAHFKLCLTALAKKSLSRAQNIFMAANINSIVFIYGHAGRYTFYTT